MFEPLRFDRVARICVELIEWQPLDLDLVAADVCRFNQMEDLILAAGVDRMVGIWPYPFGQADLHQSPYGSWKSTRGQPRRRPKS
jgi:hypothetical protein